MCTAFTTFPNIGIKTTVRKQLLHDTQMFFLNGISIHVEAMSAISQAWEWKRFYLKTIATSRDVLSCMWSSQV